MPDTTTASSVFSNRRAAVRAAERLAEGGFARNSIDVRRLHHDDEAHEVSVRVRQANMHRAEDLLNASQEVHGFGSSSSFDLKTALVVGGAILAFGALAYTLMHRDDLRRRFA